MVVALAAWWICTALLLVIDLRERFAGRPRGRASLGIWGFASALAAFSWFWFTSAHDI